METLPVDLSSPAIKFYLALVRLQVLTPLSLLLNIASILVCTLVANPSIREVSRLHPTAITPNSHAMAIYIGTIWLGQIGYCVLLVLARKDETKRAMVSAVGLALVFGNIVMGLWAIAFVMQWFLLSTILLGILLLLLCFSNAALLIYHPPVSSRPLDTALIHAPMRFYLILPFSILFPLSLFITLGLWYTPTPPGPPTDPAAYHATAAFGVVLGTNLFGLIVIALRRDIIWCIASTWIAVSLWSAMPKPAAVSITAITFTVLHPLILLLSLIYERFYSRKRPNRIALVGDERGLYNTPTPDPTPANFGQTRTAEIPNGPAEIDEETWG
ncbi:hypothetical protein JR316_0013197 [Psilocybe cubensis]|uniref:Uncharacterized protein n=2 Tax=Psilocybe cubensis TaxID=181762 RepID=A0A8H8CGW0_PSICU|nr:hypothetical protein JR316_0013197 [Psilocybe cubensis]KAH9474732.1 hypothetical protein JR316_0013197 [Psilocybe cubensis]